ncbi:MAG: hypothetical protein HY927_09425 [Elusimicrobia bacterium]|nr:hypothetical protein [Elusimicrobiota bacterium]
MRRTTPAARPQVDWEQEDEKFWRQQEKSFLSQIAQPCCSLSGMANLLVSMPGDFAVVIHGEADCANAFLHVQGPFASRFYLTRVSQVEFAAGKADQRLRRCLELIIRRKKPKVVILLGNCLMEMIHDDFESVAKEVQAKTGARILTLRTHGLKAGSQAEMVDWLYSSLAGLAQAGPAGESHRDPSGRTLVNFIALPELQEDATRRELASFLPQSGLAVNGNYPFDTSLEDWLKIGKAAASFVVDKALFPRLIAKLEEMGMPCVEVPLPVGLAQTEKFLAALASVSGAHEPLRAGIAASRERALRKFESFRGRFGGLRVAVGMRMVNNYRADQIAYDGLGDLAFFVEAGFQTTLFIQGPPEPTARRQFAKRLDQLGCRLPFHVFPDPIDLPPLLKAGRFDVAYLADHAKGEATKAGIPLVRSRSLEPFYDGAVRNLEYLEAVLKDIKVQGKGGGGVA